MKIKLLIISLFLTINTAFATTQHTVPTSTLEEIKVAQAYEKQKANSTPISIKDLSVNELILYIFFGMFMLYFTASISVTSAKSKSISVEVD